MGMRQKVEAAFTAVLTEHAVFSGEVEDSQSSQLTTRAAPMFVVDARLMKPEATGAQGQWIGLGRYEVTVTVLSPADQQEETDSAADAVHAEHVTAAEQVLQRDDLAALLSAAVEEFHVYAVIPAEPPNPDPQDRLLRDVFAFQVVATEGDV